MTTATTTATTTPMLGVLTHGYGSGWMDGYIQTCTSRGPPVDRETGRTARAHRSIVGSASGTGLGNAVGTLARVH